MKTLILALTLPLLIASCSVLKPVKDTSVNHLLDPIIPDHSISGSTPAIALTRPSLPSYLDRQQLVSRSGNGQLQMNSYHVWAEPLDAAISRVTAINLSRLTNSLNVQPVENFITLDYQTVLEIRVSRFEPDTSNNVLLNCTWKLQPVAGPLANPHPFSTSVSVATSDTATDLSGRVAAMNEALARLAREIANAR